MADWKQQLEQFKQSSNAGTRTDQRQTRDQRDRRDQRQTYDQRDRRDPKANDRRNDQRQNRNTAGYVGAPYNFVPFYDKVYQYPDDKLTKHNAMDEGLITGEVTYEVTAETPIMIDDGKQHFFRDAKGRYAIPGSTMRGLIRNNVQILGLCSYEDDIDDYALMYRNVANGAEKGQYNHILGSKQLRITDGSRSYGVGVLLNVHAGYVSNEGGKYVIYQTEVDSIKKEFEGMNYYVLSERKIISDYLKYGKKFSYGFFRKDGRSILQHEFQEFEHYEDRNGRDHYKGKKNPGYRPYYRPVSYKVAHEKDIVAVGNPGEYEKDGYAVSTGEMNEKKAVYIIPQIDRNKERIVIPEEDVRAFRIDLKKKENTLKRFGGKQYFDLPEEGKMRPVFYIRLDGRLYFGFTPRLRLFYGHTVKEGLRQKQQNGRIDYAKAMFGFASPEKSYKSKLSFSDAVLLEEAGHGKEQKLILAEPKPTSYLDYLKQNEKNTVTYNADDFELRGVKQYWLHKQPVSVDAPIKNENAASRICPLEAGAKFTGKIRFQNLTEDELGLLLWAVRLNEGSQMNVGKAKSYGYGRVSVEIKKARKLDKEKAYRSGETLCLDPFSDIEIDKAIGDYKTEINHYLGSRTIDELPHIRNFFSMKDSRNIPDDSQTRYMKLDAREYQSRKEPLPSINSIMKPR